MKHGRYKTCQTKEHSNCDSTQKILSSALGSVAFANGHIEIGQKVLLYTPSGRKVVSARGDIMGPERDVHGTGYVLEKNGQMVVNSKALGEFIILPQNSRYIPQAKKSNQSFVVAKGIEE